MSLDISKELREYKVPDNLMERFQNIMTFSKNMVLKDSKHFEKYEDDITRWFGRLMIKYFDESLTNDDITSLLKFVVDYNAVVTENIGETSSPIHTLGAWNETSAENIDDRNSENFNKEYTDEYFYKNTYFRLTSLYGLLGLTTSALADVRRAAIAYKVADFSGDQNSTRETRYKNKLNDAVNKCKNVSSFESSLLNMIYRAATKEIKKELKRISDDLTSKGEVFTIATISESDIINELFKIVFLVGSLVYDESVFSSMPDILFNNKNLIKDSNGKDLIITDSDGNNLTVFASVFSLVQNFLANNLDSIEGLEKAFIERLKFQISATSYVSEFENGIDSETADKRSASDTERSLAENGDPLIIFDIKIFNENIFTTEEDQKYIKYINKLTDKNIIGNFGDEITDGQDVCFQLLYKELNVAYRDVIESDIVDLASAMMWENIELGFIESKNSITRSIGSVIRNIPDNYFITDIYDDNEDIIGTTKLFKYRYTNPYMCRRGAESELIVYYSGDNYISNGYGQYSYQKSEISQFIGIFKETREYFYRVLLNEAFVHEEEYSAYEKTFLTFLAVMRFMDAKLDTIRDIETFTRDDIENFLTTFGLGSLAKILDVSIFLNSEAYSKALIRRYVELMQNKGSREVINVLQEVFSLNTTELVIYKNILVGEKNIDESIKLEDNDIHIVKDAESKTYKFIKVDYDTTNQLQTIIENIKNSMALSITTAPDKYWDSKNTPDKLLEELGLNISSTKYIIPEVSNEFALAYVNTRILFEIVDFIFKNADGDNSEDGKISNMTIELSNDYGIYASGSILDIINSLRYLWYRYMTLSNIKNIDYTTEGADTYYHIRTDVHKIPIEAEGSVGNGIDSFMLRKLYKYLLQIDGTDTCSKKDGYLYLSDIYAISYSNNEKDNNTIILRDKIIDLILSGCDINNINQNEIKQYLLSIAPIILYSKTQDMSFYHNKSKKYFNGSLLTGTIIPTVLTGNSLVYGLISGEIYKLNLPAEIMHFLTFLYNYIFFSKESVSEMTMDTQREDAGSAFEIKENDVYDGSIPYDDFVDSHNFYCFTSSLCNINDIEEVKNGIITVCVDLIEVCKGITFNLNLAAKDNVMISFLKTAIEYFISYTTEILNFSYRNTYKSYLDSSNVNDSILTAVTYKEIDSFYYDEELEINVEVNNE